MANRQASAVETETTVSLAQRIALIFVVTVGIIVVGSALAAAVVTFSGKDKTTTESTTALPTPPSQAVLGIDHTFEIPAE